MRKEIRVNEDRDPFLEMQKYADDIYAMFDEITDAVKNSSEGALTGQGMQKDVAYIEKIINRVMPKIKKAAKEYDRNADLYSE